MSHDLAYISSTLKGAIATMPLKERQKARECFEHYCREWSRHAAGDPLNVAFTVHELVDERIQRMRVTSLHAPQVKCRKGCAACCCVHVDIFPQEAALLRAYARQQAVEIDEARLHRQVVKDSRTWLDLSPEDRRCVFLGDDNACRVYEHRPGACRKFLVKTDPDLCDTAKHPNGRIGVVLDVEAEIIHSAAMTVYGGGSMAAMLLKLTT